MDHADAQRSARKLVAAVLVWLAVAIPGEARDAPASDPRADPAALLSALDAAWRARDADAYLRLWRLPDVGTEDAERSFLRDAWRGDEAILTLEAPLATAGKPGLATASAQVFTVAEPRGRVAQLIFSLERGADGWAIAGREEAGDIEGLVHLTLAPEGYNAAGLTVRLDDFEMTWTRGSVFTSSQSVGPTVLVFVGEGTVRFRPRPEAERDQLRHYLGQPEIVETVRAAFLRIHPADFHRVLSPGKLEPDPEAARHYPAALRMYRSQVEQAFVLDTALPRSPWWLMPALGDALVAFQGRRGVLTYSLSRSEPEGITVFDRERRLQIAVYPAKGGDTSYSEDDELAPNVVHHDLAVRFQPDRSFLAGEDTLRIHIPSPTATLRLRLDDSLRVESIRSRQGGEHLFFRVRHQDSVMVSLGPLAGRVGDIALTVRFSGVHRPEAIEHEVLQAADTTFTVDTDTDIALEPVTVYSNKTAWYPQGEPGDYATAALRLDVPAGQMAVTGGVLAPPRTENGRTVLDYRQDLPGKYITVAVGRLTEGTTGGPNLRGFAVPRMRSQAAAVLANATEILAFYEGLFGPSPYPSLNVVLMEGRTPGGHSPPGMIVMSTRPLLLRRVLRDDPATFWDIPGFFLAHELAHQWWGQGVAGQNYHERWISEAMAQYAAALWVRHDQGDAVFRTVMARMARWATRHSSQGPIHLGHRLGHLQRDPQIYRAVVYDKGAWVLHMLRELIGASPFDRALTSIQKEHRFGKVGAEHVRAALEKESGLDLAPYFREWIDGTALPELRVSHRTSAAPGGFSTAVTVTPRNLPGPVPIDVAAIHAAGREAVRVMLPPAGGTFTVVTTGRPRRIEVNAGGSILARVVTVP